jgi:putative endonuclease
MNTYWVYILCSKKNGVLYIGVTNNIARRTHEHQSKNADSFTQKYHVTKLVYAEKYENPRSAIIREKCIKNWNRAWKIELIEKHNPEWKDLSEDLL